jgi:hypothetical protein
MTSRVRSSQACLAATDSAEVMPRMHVGCKEQTMSRRAEHWLAEQEVALLAAIYELESPPEPVDRRQPTRLEAQTVRVSKSRFTE